MRYYIDTCIFLNIWKKEVGPDSETPLYETSETFLRHALEHHTVLISTVTLQELAGNLAPTEFNLLSDSLLNRTQVIEIDEHAVEKALSVKHYADTLHLLLARQHNAVLVTRDKRLIQRAYALFVPVHMPQN
jgi:predicted nucleic acid-binding protein